jgi:hypothetical protein
MIATMDPRQADAVIVGEGDAPLWEYFSRLLSAVAPISDPKGLGPLDTSSFPCKTAVSARLHGSKTQRGPVSTRATSPSPAAPAVAAWPD